MLLPSAHSRLILAFATCTIPTPRILPTPAYLTLLLRPAVLLNKRSISRCDGSSPRSWTCRPASCLCASTSPLQVDIESTPQMDHHTPVVGNVISVVVSLVSITIISSFLTQKYAAVKSWRMLPCAMWLVVAVYVDSFLFVFVTAILKYGLGVNSAYAVCDAAILLCLVGYVSTKVLIYLFLVEKAFIIRGGMKPRMRSKMWVFNAFGMLGLYSIVIILNFVFRIAHLDNNGMCVIGMERPALLPLIIFDLIVNVYLTTLFLIPLSSLHSFRNVQRSQPSLELRKIALRTFIGSLCTLTSSIVNLSVLTALNGEPGWVCLLCCNCDVLFSAIMVHWVTYHDHVGSHKGRPPATSNNERSRQNGRRSHSDSAGAVSSTDGGTFALRNSVPPLYPQPNQFPYQYRMYPRYNPKGMVEDIDIADLRYDHHRELFDIEKGPRRGDTGAESPAERCADCGKADSVAESGVSLVGCTETISGGSKETSNAGDSPQSGEGSSSSIETTRMP
ncbi:hypothetical protein FJTKL_03583 [Diaporthe vaccinii]|uniref:Integral membrane protein n=2 Tax=Diaporthe vaccinii TaxID=105482 RepID=A0ABR4DVN9_9PEZI